MIAQVLGSLQTRVVVFLATILVAAACLEGGGGAGLSSSAPGSAWQADGDRRPQAQVRVDAYDAESLTLTATFPGLDVSLEETPAGEFVKLTCPGAMVGGAEGQPGLPVLRRLFCAPEGATIETVIQEGDAEVIDLSTAGVAHPVLPYQPPVLSSSADSTAPAPDAAPFQYDRSAYLADASAPAERVAITKAGITGRLHLYSLEVRPVSYNPARGVLTVWHELSVRLRFHGGTRGYEGVLPRTAARAAVLNPPPVSASGSRTPEHLLIVNAQVFAASAPLTQFVNAKTAQGFTVTTYTAAVGTERTVIKNYIKSVYESSTPPDYLLVIGDANMFETAAAADTIPIWPGSGSIVYTDLHWVTMDAGDDWFADMAFGRWPVRTVSDLQQIVTKTLYVENENYADPTYVKRAMFITGSDPNAAGEAIHDEIIAEYMIPNGIAASKHYTSQGANTAKVLDSFDAGAFLTVYYGHSAFELWSDPLFTLTDVDALANVNMYPFIVSFSCSTTAFPQTIAEPGLHEKFMRVGGKGASATWGSLLVLYDWPTTADLYRCLMTSLYTSGIREVGPAVLGAQNLFIAAYGVETRVSRYYAEEMELFADPSLKIPVPPGKNYLVVTAPTYSGSAPLNELIASREARGFNVSTYVVPSGTTNNAIKSYIYSLWGTAAAPDYVVIIGDTNGFTSTASTIPHFVGLGPRDGTTDWPYVCMDTGDDWYPEIPIGRLSVQNVTQLQAVVNKTIKVESGNFTNPDYVKRGTFLANSSSDIAAIAESTHNWVIDTYFTPNGYTGVKVYGSQGGGTAQVSASVNTGSLWTVYMGHSADTGWWNPAFYQADVNALTNNGLYGLAMGWSCHSAQYELGECYGETWLRAANKGAAAYISASQYIYWGSAANWQPSVVCEKDFFTSIFLDENWEIGPAWLNGMYRFLKDYGGWDGIQGHVPPYNADKCRDFMEEFVILGDPALELPRPFGFTMESTPASAEVCSPPSNQAGFNLQIGQTGGFNEVVVLSATGTPMGATIQFSNNAQIPPFSSVMTVSNLGSVAAGTYTITVTGTSPSRTRTTNVSLGVSHDLPGTVTLSSPADGAVEVARQPTLVWQAAAGATGYNLQIARDIAFGDVVYTKTLAGTSHTVESSLLAGTHFFWRVRATNGCGQGSYSSPFSFTTIVQAIYFTQQFSSSGFDLDYFTVRFIPDGSGSYYRMCGDPATVLPSNPSGGTTLSISEDSYVMVTPGRTVKLYGQNYTSFYVNENGNITFNGGDTTYQESLSIHFSRPRIAAMFNDLWASGGTRSWKVFPDRVVVTFENVHEYNASNNLNTFQTEMFDNGEIRITWLRMDATTGIVGLSAGNGLPSDFVPTDLSAATTCLPRGACCNGGTCSFVTQTACTAGSGVYLGDNLPCSPNPCLDYAEGCVIISEVVDATLSGGCPKFIEITNTAATDFAFIKGGVIVQHDSESDVNVDVSLAGLTIPAGQSVVVNSNEGGTCTGAFQGAYGYAADINTQVAFGDGDDRYLLTDEADGSNILDVYGEPGVDGTGRVWEYTMGYAYRRPAYISGRSTHFAPQEWFFGGPGSLDGPNAEELIDLYTTPDEHAFTGVCTGFDHKGDMNCDWYLDATDIQLFIQAIINPGGYSGCDLQRADLNGDGLYNLNDCQPFVDRILGS